GRMDRFGTFFQFKYFSFWAPGYRLVTPGAGVLFVRPDGAAVVVSPLPGGGIGWTGYGAGFFEGGLTRPVWGDWQAGARPRSLPPAPSRGRGDRGGGDGHRGDVAHAGVGRRGAAGVGTGGRGRAVLGRQPRGARLLREPRPADRARRAGRRHHAD